MKKDENLNNVLEKDEVNNSPETNIADADVLFDKLNEFEIKCVRFMKFCDQRLSWIRRKIRFFIRSPLQCFEKVLDTNGTIVAGFTFGLMIGILNLFGS